MNFKRKNRFLSLTGFTLIELFLVSALLGIVLMGIFSSYAAGVKVWSAVNRLLRSEDSKFFMSFHKVKSELMGYIREFDDIEIEGDRDHLTFPVISDLQIMEVTYKFDKSEDALMREAVKFSESLKDKMNPEVNRLFEAEKVEFSYLFFDDKCMTAEWLGKFTEKDNGFPEAVKLEITRNGKKDNKFIFIPK